VAAAVIFVAAGSLVVAEDTDPLAVGAGPDDLEEDEPHAASRMVMKRVRLFWRDLRRLWEWRRRGSGIRGRGVVLG